MILQVGLYVSMGEIKLMCTCPQGLWASLGEDMLLDHMCSTQ